LAEGSPDTELLGGSLRTRELGLDRDVSREGLFHIPTSVRRQDADTFEAFYLAGIERIKNMTIKRGFCLYRSRKIRCTLAFPEI